MAKLEFSQSDKQYLSEQHGQTTSEIKRMQRILNRVSCTVDRQRISAQTAISMIGREQFLNCLANCYGGIATSAITLNGRTVFVEL